MKQDPALGIARAGLTGPAAGRRIEEAFLAQARRAPDRPALLHQGRVLSYGDLDTLSSRIAHRLKALGARPNGLVGLFMNRSPQMIAAMLAVLKTGAAYLPLDPAYPAERLRFMLEDSAAPILISDGPLPGDLAFGGVLLDLDHARAAIDAAPSVPIRHGGSAEDLAYVIYTSGSTGRPKGVMLAHGATQLIDWMASAFAQEDLARVAATTSICFDPSVIEIFGTLGIGSLIILKTNALERFLPGEDPTYFGAPPSILNELAQLGAIPDSVRILHVGGEPLTMALVQLLFETCRAREIHNQYGLTETTTCNTVARIARGHREPPTIGKPIAGARIYLLDPQGRPVPSGAEGEIHIAGPGVARGYLGGGAAAARFSDDPFEPGERMYRTGDLGCFTPEGNLAFKGRVDTQVKLRGFRVEIGEVEAALMRLDRVRQAAAIVHRDPRGRDRLVAFLASDARIDAADARRRLASWLPAHMLPSRFVTVDRLPLSSSGKIERAALTAALIGQEPEGPAPILFESTIEEAIARTFSKHLGNVAVGPQDDFYALGGDSLLALDVAIDLEALFGKGIAPALLAHNVNPSALAAALATVPAERTAILTPLQSEGVGPALFCTPDLYGRSFSYVSLARRLEAAQRLTGLTPGPHAEAFIDAPDMRALSRVYRDAIRSVQPNGPYLISGYSFGAVQAFDLACLLEAEGASPLLVLIDGPLSCRRPSLRYILRWLGRETPRTIAERGVDETVRGILRTHPLWMRLLTGSRARVRKTDVPSFVPAIDRTLARAMMQSVVDYRPQPYTGRCLFLRSSEPYPLYKLLDEDGKLGWDRWLAGPTESHAIPGTHMRMMQEPLVGTVATVLQDHIAATLRSPQ